MALPAEALASKDSAVISRMFSAFTIKDDEQLARTHHVLNLFGDRCRRLHRHLGMAGRRLLQVVQNKNTVFAATGRARDVKANPPNFLTPRVFWLTPTSRNHNTAN